MMKAEAFNGGRHVRSIFVCREGAGQASFREDVR